MTTRSLLEGYYNAVWVEGDMDAIDRYMAPGARAFGLVPDMDLGVEDLRVMVEALLALVESPRFTVTRMVEADDWVAALVVFDATATATGAPIRAETLVMCRIEDGLIREAHNSFDTFALAAQMGVVPPDLLPRVLAGERFA